MPTWKGIIGRPMSIDEFSEYTKSLARTLGARKFDWVEFCVVHNTQIPTFAQWHSVSGERRMKALEAYYRDTQGWSGGPHLFIADDFIWPFTPLWLPGVHSPSWNGKAWGVEFVGDYSKEKLSFGVFNNGIGALAALHRMKQLDPATIRFHKEDPKTTHDGCPGKNIDKTTIIRGVDQALGLNRIPPIVSAGPRLLKRGMTGADVMELQRLLGMLPLSSGAGIFGPLTERKLVAFQIAHGLESDGVYGPATRRVLQP